MKILGFVVRACAGVASRFRNIWYRLLGVKITGYVWMRRVSIPRNWQSITLHKGTSLDDGVVLLASGDPTPNKIVIEGAYINRYTIITAHHRVVIGRGCMIGPHCYITDADHGTQPETPIGKQKMLVAPTIIESGAWIGAGVTILKGVTVGQGAVIGAGAVVTGSVPANTVVAGVPAKILRSRS